MIESRKIYTLLIAVATMLNMGVAVAEQPTISARFSKDSIEVGDWVEYIIDIEKDRTTEIGVPIFGGNLTAKEQKEEAQAKLSMSTYEEYDEDIFELVEDYPLDTIKVEGRKLHLRKRYKLAVMETGVIPMRPAILYFDKNREVHLSAARNLELVGGISVLNTKGNVLEELLEQTCADLS